MAIGSNSLNITPRLQACFKVLGFTILWLCMMSVVVAQTPAKIDSLQKELAESAGEQRFEILRELFTLYNQLDYNKSFEVAEDAVNTALESGDTLLIIRSYRMKGYALMNLAKNPQAIKIFQEALQISQQDKSNLKAKEQIKFILNSIALAYTDMGDYPTALEYHFQSLVLREEEGNKLDISIAVNNIGLVYYRMSDYQKAIEFYQRCFALKKEIDDNIDNDRLLINMALCYISLNEFEKAIARINDAMDFCGKACSDEIKREAMNGLGIAYLQTNKIPEAREAFMNSLKIAKSQNNIPFTALNLIYLGRVDQKDNEGKMSESFFKEAENLIEGTGYSKVQLELYQAISEFYRSKDDYQKSLNYSNKYIALYKQSFNETMIKNLSRVETNYAERENIKTISEQNDIIALKDQVLGKQRTITVLAMVIALLLLGFTYFAIQSDRTYSAKLKRHNEELEQRVLERTKELQKSNEKLLKAQHDLNNFLYKTSHDIRGPVATLKGLYNLITTKQNEPEELKDLIVRKGVQIEKIYKILNRISMVTSIQNIFLKPEVIDFHALLNDIVDFERKNGQLKHIRVLVDVEPGLKMISDPYLIHLILENMVDNSLKFFNESTRIDPYVKITVSTSGSDALIKVEDNGVGIIMKPGQDVFTMFLRGSERSDIGGVGLYLCKVIADKLEGTIKLEKTSKEGTTFSLKLTLDATEQIKAWNTYLESEYRQEMERQVEYEKREQDAEQGGKASNPFIAT